MGERISPIQAKAVNCLHSGELSEDSCDHYSAALIPFHFISFPSLAFPQNTGRDNATAIDSFLLILMTPLLPQVTLY